RIGWYAAIPAFACAALLALNVQRGQRRVAAHTQRLDALAAAQREAEAAHAALKAQTERTLALVRDAIPAGDAKTYVDENLARYDALARLDADAENKRRYYENYPKPELKDVPAQPVARPETPRETLERELERIGEARVRAQSRADHTAGRLQAIGDALELEASLAQKRERLADAQNEYDAIQLAMDALERANTALQSRFSPALGKRAAEYFAALTDGKYGAVALDRSFRALATERGESAARDAALLSQGALDQLYLAVRLAICDMALPEEKHVPLVLDDALTSFDDARCGAALELLYRLTETRQVLLLTSQHREAAYLAGRSGVNVVTL
ncbi:MAG: hypothetical protein IJT71_03955, partial [Oscillospiraceae bacterium]|nr:hypothetical protein [Oscillospiraceae bacterium]